MSEFTRSDREDALRIATERLSSILEFDAYDILVVADWVLTGSCDKALAFAEINSQNYAKYFQQPPDDHC